MKPIIGWERENQTNLHHAKPKLRRDESKERKIKLIYVTFNPNIENREEKTSVWVMKRGRQERRAYG